MKYLYTAFVLFIPMACSPVDDNLRGRWVNTSPESEGDVGSISFNDEIKVTLASGKSVAMKAVDRMEKFRFETQTSDSIPVIWSYHGHSNDVLTMTARNPERIDTVRFLRYETLEPSSVTRSTLKSLMVDNYWRVGNDSAWYRFFDDATALQTTRSNGLKSYYRFEWEIFYFDSLLFLHSISVTQDVSLVERVSDNGFTLANLERQHVTNFTIDQVDTAAITRHESALLGSWRIDDKQEFSPRYYRRFNFANILSLKSLFAETATGYIKAGEWNMDYSGGVVVIKFYQDVLLKMIEVKIDSKQAILCEDGFCYTYTREEDN